MTGMNLDGRSKKRQQREKLIFRVTKACWSIHMKKVLSVTKEFEIFLLALNTGNYHENKTCSSKRPFN